MLWLIIVSVLIVGGGLLDKYPDITLIILFIIAFGIVALFPEKWAIR